MNRRTFLAALSALPVVGLVFGKPKPALTRQVLDGYLAEKPLEITLPATPGWTFRMCPVDDQLIRLPNGKLMSLLVGDELVMPVHGPWTLNGVPVYGAKA